MRKLWLACKRFMATHSTAWHNPMSVVTRSVVCQIPCKLNMNGHVFASSAPYWPTYDLHLTWSSNTPDTMNTLTVLKIPDMCPMFYQNNKMAISMRAIMVHSLLGKYSLSALNYSCYKIIYVAQLIILIFTIIE